MRTLALIPLLLLMLGLLPSCDDEETLSPAYTDYRYDLVTYLGRRGGGEAFEYLGRNDSVAVTLLSQDTLAGTLPHPGQRLLLRYLWADNRAGDTERAITLLGANAIVSDSLRLLGNEAGLLPRHAVKLLSLWRTGPYLNLHCQVEYTGEPRRMALTADSTALPTDTVDLWLVHDVGQSHTQFWRDCYASFYIGMLPCRTARVWINDTVRPLTPFRILPLR